jgi:hypothetical protein
LPEDYHASGHSRRFARRSPPSTIQQSNVKRLPSTSGREISKARLHDFDGIRRIFAAIALFRGSGQVCLRLSYRGIARRSWISKEEIQVFGAKHCKTPVFLMQLMYLSFKAGELEG